MAARKTKTTPATKTSNSVPAKTTNSATDLTHFRPKILILPIVIIVLALLIWIFKNQFIVATVNGQPITRLALINELEKKSGKSVLESLVTEKLIVQEATKKNIEVTTNDVNGEIAKIEKSITAQGQNLDTVLTQQGMTRADLTKQVKLQLMLKKMVGKIEVTQKEIDKYIEANKASIPENSNMTTIKTQVTQQLQQQKLSEKISSFITALQKKAKIEYWKNF